MKTLIKTFLNFVGLATREERDDLARKLNVAQLFAKSVAEGVSDYAVIVGADETMMNGLILDRPVLVLPGVNRTVISGCFWKTDTWREAIDEALSTVHLSVDGKTPREALAALIEWHNRIALDPRVSSEAAALMQRGRDEPAADAQALREAAILARVALKESWFYLGPGTPGDSINSALNALDAALGTDRSEDKANSGEDAQALKEALSEVNSILDDALDVLRMVDHNDRIDAGGPGKAWSGQYVIDEVRRVLALTAYRSEAGNG
jgi:hypothetical protein